MWNVIFGGLTGLIGSVTTSITNYKLQKMKNEHDEKMIELETTAMIRETEANIKINEAEIQGEIEIADTKAYTKSIEEGNKSLFNHSWVDKLLSIEGNMRFFTVPCGILIAFLFGIVDFLKALMRPGLTMYLVGCTTWITYMSYGILETYGTAITSASALLLFTDVTNIIIYLTVSCVTWWFGDRRVAKFLMRLSDNNIKK